MLLVRSSVFQFGMPCSSCHQWVLAVICLHCRIHIGQQGGRAARGIVVLSERPERAGILLSIFKEAAIGFSVRLPRCLVIAARVISAVDCSATMAADLGC
ncbi:hypothetical protein ACLOJK_008209 [Asimina triloba]